MWRKVPAPVAYITQLSAQSRVQYVSLSRATIGLTAGALGGERFPISGNKQQGEQSSGITHEGAAREIQGHFARQSSAERVTFLRCRWNKGCRFSKFR